jgi:hypothetical protein
LKKFSTSLVVKEKANENGIVIPSHSFQNGCHQDSKEQMLAE